MTHWFLAISLSCIMSLAGQALAAGERPVIPAGKDNDLKLYLTGGNIVLGASAMERMQKEAEVILWLAGNQFFAMDKVIAAFQKRHPSIRVGLVTLPPGLLLDAIVAGGWRYQDRPYAGLPDVYASVNLGHLKKLKAIGLMDEYFIYMHNELEIMVAAGNPKAIRGIGDLVRTDVQTSLPNPVNEGIMQFYARRVLERHGYWTQIAAGKECFSCQTTRNNWFTAVHHRETPERIRDGLADAGIVWKTETLEAIRDGAKVSSVSLPAVDSLRDEVSYVIGAIKSSPREDAAEAFLNFVASAEGQAVYEQFGFVGATTEERKRRPVD